MRLFKLSVRTGNPVLNTARAWVSTHKGGNILSLQNHFTYLGGPHFIGPLVADEGPLASFHLPAILVYQGVIQCITC